MAAGILRAILYRRVLAWLQKDRLFESDPILPESAEEVGRVKMTYEQMILIFIFVALIFLSINIYYPERGPWVTMGIMIIIFIAFKIHQFRKKEAK